MNVPWIEYWRLFRRYLAAQRGAVLCMAALLLADIGLQLVGPQVVRGFIDAARAGAGGNVLFRAGGLFLIVSLAQQGATVGAVYWGERVAWTATNALRVDLAAHLLRLDPSYHQARTPGELIERVDGDVNALAHFFSGLAIELASNVLLLAGIVVATALVDAQLGLAFFLLGAASLAAFGWVRRRGTPHWEADRQRSALFYGYLGEVLAAKEDLRACGARPYTMRRLVEHLRVWLPVTMRAEVWESSTWAVGSALFCLAHALTYGLGGGLYQAGTLSLGTLYAVVAYAAMLDGPIGEIGNQIGDLQRASASIVRVRELLAARPRIEDGTESVPPGSLPVAVRGVRFAYPGARADCAAVLEDLSFELGAGRVLGLLGRTGSGKTTIARLLYRLYDPQQGEVRVGGVDLRRARQEVFRARVGYVPQDVQLLEGSLRDNLTFYDESIADERLCAVLEELGLGPWLSRLPEGLDTRLAGASSSGAGLSAGEAQLVALARVFLKDPGLVVLDEASSRLDPATEAMLEGALDRLLDGRTAVIIAHRLATVARADEILILSAGRVVERGPRAQLARDKSSAYARLLRTGLEEVLV